MNESFLRSAAIACLLVVAACGGSSSDDSRNDTGDASSSDTDTVGLPDTATSDTAPLPPSACPGRLAAVAPSGTVFTVGSGMAVTCTEKALRDALTAAKAAGGGTVTFSCGGKATIVVASALAVGSAKDKTVILEATLVALRHRSIRSPAVTSVRGRARARHRVQATRRRRR